MPVKPIPEVVSGAHLVVLAIPDDVLAELIAGLATTGTFTAGQLVMHTSGRYGISVFESAIGSDLVPLALHPAMTFTGTDVDLERLQDCCFGVTTVDMARPLAEALVIEMGGDPVWIPEDERLTYHAALAHGANHLVTLVGQAMELLGQAGIDDPSRVLEPLLSAALANPSSRVMLHSPAPSRGETPVPLPGTWRCSARWPRTSARPTSRSPGPPRSGPC